MGLLFNNYWELSCRTYLELNGYFVLSNLFADLHDLRASHPTKPISWRTRSPAQRPRAVAGLGSATTG